MPKSSEQTQQDCDVTLRYLIIKEALEGKQEDVSDKIINEAKEFYLDDFAKENHRKNSASSSVDEEYRKQLKQEILEEFENKKAQLDNLSLKTKTNLKKLFFDDKLKIKLTDEGPKNEIVEAINKIYTNIEQASERIDLFKKLVNKVARTIFAITATNAVLAGDSSESINKGESIKAIFKSSINGAFKIASEVIKTSTSHADFVNFVSEKVTEITQKSGNEDLEKLNQKRIEYQGATESRALEIKTEFSKDLKSFYAKTENQENIDKSNLIFDAFSCYLQKEKISTEGQGFAEREIVLSVASIFVQSGANAHFNYGCKLLPNSDVKKHLNQIGEASYYALDAVQTLNEQSQKLRVLIDKEDEFLHSLMNSFGYFNRTVTTLASGLIENAIDSFKQKGKETLDKSSQTANEFEIKIDEISDSPAKSPLSKISKSKSIEQLMKKFEESRIAH
jgi:hypothetical protein